MQYVCQFIAHNKENHRHPICLSFSPADICSQQQMICSHNPFIFMQPLLFLYIASSATCCHFTPFPLCSPSQTELTRYYSHFVIARWAHTEVMEHTGRKENLTLEFLHMSFVSPEVCPELNIRHSGLHLPYPGHTCGCAFPVKSITTSSWI